MTVSPQSTATARRICSALVPWLCLAAAIGWSILIRVPLILNAAIHLDSDLAVDGITLQEAVAGHWRWHYPGTPYSGIGAVFLSWLQARIWGVDSLTLVSGGTVAHVLVLLSVFALMWRVFSPSAAVWSLVPLTFASTGMLWLSGRITGGHLLVVAWSAIAWLLVHESWVRSGWLPTLVLGFWCGLGIYLDSMFVMTLAGIVVTGLVGWYLARNPQRGGGSGSVASANLSPLKSMTRLLGLLIAFSVGAAPRAIGTWVDPYDAYREQFAATPRSPAPGQSRPDSCCWTACPD